MFPCLANAARPFDFAQGRLWGTRQVNPLAQEACPFWELALTKSSLLTDVAYPGAVFFLEQFS